jgi:uncharacterized protein (TIGR04255 family)
MFVSILDVPGGTPFKGSMMGESMYEGIFYQKTFLNQVVARFDFVSPIPGIEKALPAQLSNALSELFPIVEPQEAIAYQLQFGAGGPQQHQTAFKQWNFFGKEREKQLVVALQFAFIVYTAYTSFEDLKANVSAVADALGRTYPDIRVGRFGLRYVNKIEIDGLAPVTSWNEYISPLLVSATPFFQADKLTRLVEIAEMKCGDLDLRFQFGMPNPDYPAPMKRPSFVLDFDSYIQTAHELPKSLQYMEQAHECIQSLFERSITDKLRECMNVTRAPAAVQE